MSHLAIPEPVFLFSGDDSTHILVVLGGLQETKGAKHRAQCLEPIKGSINGNSCNHFKGVGLDNAKAFHNEPNKY